MEKFYYKAKDTTGAYVTGQIDAKDQKEVVNLLREKQLVIIEISSLKNRVSFNLGKFFEKVSFGEIVTFTRQFSSMITTGLTVSETLALLIAQTKNRTFARILRSIEKDIQAGNSLSMSMSKFPKVFSPIYVALIKAAETSGILDKILLRLADNLEKEQAFKSKIKGALTYPVVIVVGIVVVMGVMMVFVIPQLSTLYESLNIDLPLPTRIIIGISNFIGHFWFLVIGAVIFFIVGFNRWKNTETGTAYIDSIVLRLPVFGALQKELILTELTRTLGLLIGSGTPILEAINIVSQTTGNIWYRQSLQLVSQKVEKGVSLALALSSDQRYPLILTQMVRVGETTGKIDDSLLRVSSYFEMESTQTVATMTTLLEPFIMVVLGLGVAFLIISIITPIYNLTSAIQ